MIPEKVLIVTYSFPPDLDGGVFRPLKFVKYLPQYRWNPIVLKSKIKLQKEPPIDKSLNKELSPNLRIIETYSLCKKIYDLESVLKNYSLQVPDYQIGWIPFGVLGGIRTIFKENIDIIYTTGPPHSTHLIGLILKGIFKIPWIVDFRDPWTRNLLKTECQNKIHKKIDEKLEHLVVVCSDKIITVTDPIRDDLISKYKSIPKDKFMTIPNGYDYDDFREIHSKRSNKFTITYTGSFYGPISPNIFFKSLSQLIIDKPELKSSIKFVIAGQMIEDLIIQQIRNFELEDIIEFKGVVPYKESLELMVNSDLLLFILPPGDETKKVYTTKIFNYLAAGKPILGITPKGIAADLIIKSKSGTIVDPEDIEGIKSSVYNSYLKYLCGSLNTETNLKVIKEYDRKKLTKKLAQVFNEVTYKKID